MTKQVGHLIDNLDASAAYWQYRHKSTEYEGQQPYKQTRQHTEDTGIILFGILFTIGFLALLAVTTLRNIL